MYTVERNACWVFWVIWTQFEVRSQLASVCNSLDVVLTLLEWNEKKSFSYSMMNNEYQLRMRNGRLATDGWALSTYISSKKEKNDLLCFKRHYKRSSTRTLSASYWITSCFVSSFCSVCWRNNKLFIWVILNHDDIQ